LPASDVFLMVYKPQAHRQQAGSHGFNPSPAGSKIVGACLQAMFLMVYKPQAHRQQAGSHGFSPPPAGSKIVGACLQAMFF
jgi:hypothetical protein